MNTDRAIGIILSLSVGAVLGLGTWLLWHAHHAPPPEPQATVTPSITPTAEATATVTGAIPRAAVGYRLAGTVVGDVSYAVIVAPGGHSELVRTGQILKGLGQLTSIEQDRVTIVGDDGTFDLRVASAPTVTATAVVTPPTAVPPPTRVPSVSESSP
ncbi:MAG TPA: hypothetical protein VL049_24160 [Candidatus Dormibacteraeota bacterium]|nr:hypothetical protein [Candidatus Dormibacteraeota bacterium]